MNSLCNVVEAGNYVFTDCSFEFVVELVLIMFGFGLFLITSIDYALRE